MNLVKLHPRAV